MAVEKTMDEGEKKRIKSDFWLCGQHILLLSTYTCIYIHNHTETIHILTMSNNLFKNINKDILGR